MAIVAWASLILQFYVIVTGQGIVTPNYNPTLLTSIINFFSYFTILSNILAALLTTFAVLARGSDLGHFFARPVVTATVAMATVIVGIIYTTILRHLWEPQGLQLVADVGLHYMMPVLFTIYWLAVVPKGALRFGNVPVMLVYPVIYGVYTLVRGPFADWYPYPFISVKDLGYPQTFTNIAGMLVLFAAVGAVLVLIDRGLARVRA